MKESGINYFFNILGLETGDFQIFYTFEEGTGATINSISGGQNIYTGTLNAMNNFWSKPGSGFFSGNLIQISNASGLNYPAFTHVFIYEQIETGQQILFDSLQNTSGYRIGITPTNKIYFETYNNNPICAASYNNLSSKNLIYVNYTTNNLSIGYYNFNSQLFESETFNYNFNFQSSNQYYLGNGFTGYMDYYLYFSNYYNDNILNSLASGFYNVKTGIGYNVETFYSTGITGYTMVNNIQTGITGYSILPSGFDGVGDFTGLFPMNNIVTTLTGIIQTGLIQSGITGLITINNTGSLTDLLQTFTGYVSSFGMDDIVSMRIIPTNYIVKNSVSYTPFDNNYNINLQNFYSGYLINSNLTDNNIILYINGLAQNNSGWMIDGSGNMIISGLIFSPSVFIDIKNGDRNTGDLINYSGQQIFLNGLNLISGYDYITNGVSIIITGNNTGISGLIFDEPIVLNYNTGNSSIIYTGNKFSRNTSLVFFNGLRQLNKYDYIEDSKFDLINQNNYNENNLFTIYNNDNLYWDQ